MNAWKAKELSFSVYDRSGQLVFFTKENLGKWNGTFKGVRLPTGIYVWLLMYTDETGRKITRKGFASLIR
jgi:gliding motility-associated-like protein